MSGSPLLQESTDGVMRLTLNRPDALNAFNLELLEALGEAFRQAEGDVGVRAVVLTGAGRAFSAGQDMRALEEIGPPGKPLHLGPWLRTHYNPLILKMRSLEKPIVAAVNGVAAGAGMSLALASDIRIASIDASFTQAFAALGLVPDAGSTFFLPRLVGLGKALELCLTADRIDAGEALRLGLVSRVVPAEELDTAALELTNKLASAAGKAIGLIKRGLNRALAASLDESLEYEALLQEVAGRTEDFREGVIAFSEKRPPRFLGR